MNFTILTTRNFDLWLHQLRDRRALARIRMHIDRAKGGNFGDCAPVGKGVWELRIHYGPGYRIYFKQTGLAIIILLAGGDKSTQKRDIDAAVRLARDI